MRPASDALDFVKVLVVEVRPDGFLLSAYPFLRSSPHSRRFGDGEVEPEPGRRRHSFGFACHALRTIASTR